MIGELKLELIQPRHAQDESQNSVKERLKRFPWANLINFFTLLAVIYYANQARIGNNLTREGQRPWVGIDGLIEPVGMFDGGFKIAPVIKNFGTSAAVGVLPQIRYAASLKELVTMADRVCNDAWAVQKLTTEYPNNVFGRLLMPSDKFYWPSNVSDVSLVGDANRFLIGCIVYTDQFERPHQTRFCAQLTPDQAYPDKPITPCNMYNDTK